MAPPGAINLLLRNKALLEATHGSGVGNLVGDCVVHSGVFLRVAYGVGNLVGWRVGNRVGKRVGKLVGWRVGCGVGWRVGCGVGWRVGCGVGDGVGQSVNGHRSNRFRSVHNLSLDVRVRNLIPLLPHEAVHALKAPKLEYVAGLHVHTKLLHGRRKIRAPHPRPPKAGCRKIVRRRTWKPPPHVLLHPSHLLNALVTQWTA